MNLCRVNRSSFGIFVRSGLRSLIDAAQGVKPYSTSSSTQEDLGAIHKLVVANRGEIACRVLTTAKRLGVPTVALFSDADRHSKHVKLADEAYHIGGAAARDSYLRADAILNVCVRAGGRSVHPGYGFLSENAAFSESLSKAGISFVGPPAAAIRAMGDKSEAKRIMSAAGVPVVPGYHGEEQSEARLAEEAARIGFPLLVKAVSGGGGKGMKLALNAAQLPEALASAKREAASSFGDDRVLLERYIQRPRHVEVQVIADKLGHAVYLFDRDCSLQRRHQKVIEEAPAPGLTQEFHQHIGEAAVRAAQAVGYVNAGTVEFIVDEGDPQRPFYFMEMNTRLQVEHPVSEEVSGVDLVEWQLRVAAGLPLPALQDAFRAPRGHAFEARLYAESPRNNFLPGAGTVVRWRPPATSVAFVPGAVQSSTGAAPLVGLPAGCRIRVDSGVEEGDSVGTFYDPMIAKIITWGPDRAAALQALRVAMANTQVSGLPVNLPFLRRLAAHPAFESAEELTTAFIKDHLTELMAPATLPERAAALAAVARFLLQVKQHSVAPAAAGGPGGAWSIADSKRLWSYMSLVYDDMAFPEGEGGPDAKLKLVVKVLSGQDFEVSKAGTHSRVRDARLVPSGAAAAAAAGTAPPGAIRPRGWRLEAEVEGAKVVADVSSHAAGGHEVLSLWMEGEVYEFRWAVPSYSKQLAAGSTHAPGGQVQAPMPGRVVKLLVAEGDKVEAGALLVVLEAMKMEHPLAAPRSGVVRGLSVGTGSQVGDGQVLMWVDDGSGDSKAAAPGAKA